MVEEIPQPPSLREEIPRPQVLHGEHPLNKPAVEECLAEPALFSLSESKMKELAKSIFPVMKPEADINSSRSQKKESQRANEVTKIDSGPITTENMFEKLAEIVTPFCKMRYTAQLEEKERRACKVLNTLKKRLNEVYALSLPAPQPRLACPLQPIIASVRF